MIGGARGDQRSALRRWGCSADSRRSIDFQIARRRDAELGKQCRGARVRVWAAA